MRLLFAEDEKELLRATAMLLKMDGYEVDTASDGEEALQKAISNRYDGLVLDIMMPRRSGLSVLAELRNSGDMTPVILLTAKTQIEDRVQGLDMGANDYLCKPFATKELEARLNAMLRSRDALSPAEIRMSNIRLIRESQTLEGDTGSVSLSNTEFLLLEHFVRNAKTLFTAEELHRKFWPDETNPAVVDIYIGYLRHKLTSVSAKVKVGSPSPHAYTLDER